jgi:hypothetical protein
VHDFKDKHLGKAIPHSIYDLASDQGWVTVGIDHDTAAVRLGDGTALAFTADDLYRRQAA